MSPLFRIPSILFKLAITFCVLFGIFMFYALADTDEFDMINFFALLTIKPIFGIILISITIFITYLLGLPIRLNSKINLWWKNNPGISLIYVSIGILLSILSLLPYFENTVPVTINGEQTTKQIPNDVLSILGWFIIAFGLFHYYPKTFLKIISLR